MKRLIYLFPVLGALCLFGAVFPTSNAHAAIAQNVYYDLDDTAAAIEPPQGWSQLLAGGIRGGISIYTTGAADTRFYTRDDLAIGSGENWVIEAVISSPAVGAMGERGARMSIKFTDASALMLPPAGVEKYRHVDLRLEEDNASGRRFALVDGSANTEMGSLALDWSATSPRWRVRIMRQGNDIVMEAEQAHTGPLMSDPLNFPETPSYSVTVPVSNFSFPVGVASQFGFGHYLGGNYFSEWENIHVTVADDSSTALPYWPPLPPAPTLVHDDKGACQQQGIDFSADFSASSYLSNDTVTPELDADGTTYTGQARVNITALESWDFDSLNDNQLVYGRITATEASGRSTTGSDSNAAINSNVHSDGGSGALTWMLLVLLLPSLSVRRAEGLKMSKKMWKKCGR